MDQPRQNLAPHQEEESLGQEEEEESLQEEQEDEEEDEEEGAGESEPDADTEQEENEEEAPPSDEQPPSTQIDDSVPAPTFDPSRMIGTIRRKSVIKELAAMYHAECLSYCQELLELQRKGDEPLVDLKRPEDLKKDAIRPPKRVKKTVRH